MSSHRREIDYFVDKGASRSHESDRFKGIRDGRDSRYGDYSERHRRSHFHDGDRGDNEHRRYRHRHEDEDNRHHNHRRFNDSSRDKRGRDPSPISSSILPLDQWPRKLKCWDIPPSGFENMSAAQVKNTGLFIPATYQPKVTNLTPFVDPARTTFLFQQSAGISSSDQTAIAAAINPALAKQARRLYVGGIPVTSTAGSLEAFFNELMESYGFVVGSGHAVEEVIIAPDRSYAFVDFRSVAETTSALAFDGITYEGHILKVRRPKDYVVEGSQVESGAAFENKSSSSHLQISSVVPDSPNKIFIGNIPYNFTDDEVIAILTSFGELRSFNLVRDSSGFSKGYAFCEYLDPELTDIVVQGLHMFEVGDKRLTVQKAMASPSVAGIESPATTTDAASILQSITSGESLFGRQTSVLQLMNMCTIDDLAEDAEYEGIIEDVHKECSKFGTVIEVWVPRADSIGSQFTAAGKVFVKFEKISQATAALHALAGRQFLDRNVLTAYYDEQKFEKHILA